MINKINELYAKNPCSDFLPSIGYNQIDAENFEALAFERQIAPADDAVQIAMPKTH